MRGKITGTVVVLAGLLPLQALGLGVGQIDVRSALNEELRAEIPLAPVSAAELQSLEVALASATAFQQAGMDRVPVLTSLAFEVVELDPGRAQVRVTSAEPVREPLLNFLVEFRWTGGRLVREFVVFLDPPSAVLTQPGARAVAAAPVRAATPAVAPRPAVATVPGATYGPVARGETLWRIADRMRPQGVSVHEMMNALLAANPGAFNRPSVDALRAGAVLRIPDLPGVRIDPPAITTETAVASAEPPSSDAGPRVLVEAPEEDPVPELAEIQPLASILAPPTGQPAFRIMLADGRPRLRVADLDDLRARIGSLVGVDDAALTAVVPVAPVPGEPRPDRVPDPVPAGGTAAAGEGARADPVVPPAVGAGEPAAPALAAATHPAVAPAPAGPPAATVAEPPPAPPPGMLTRVMDSASGIASTTGDWITHRLEATGLRDNPATMAAGGGAAVLLLGLLTLMMRRRRGREAIVDVPAVPDPGFQTVAVPVTDEQTRPESRFEGRDRRSGPTPATGVTNPMERVDLLLAVGNYREAENVARSALAEDVTNVALAVKLLEVHFATSNETAFAQEAELLHGRLGDESDPQWEQVVNMGRRLCPEHSLFGGTASTAPPPEPESESVGQGDEFAFEIEPGPETGDGREEAERPVSRDAVEELGTEFGFDLADWDRPEAPQEHAGGDDVRKTALEAEPRPGGATAREDDFAGLDLELPPLEEDATGGFPGDDRTPSLETVTEDMADAGEELDNLTFFDEDNRVPSADAEHDPLLDELKDLEFGLEYEESGQELPAEEGDREGADDATARTVIEDESATADDEVETRLALAEAYLDLDDRDGARSLLEEVVREGTEPQRQRAQEMLSRMN